MLPSWPNVGAGRAMLAVVAADRQDLLVHLREICMGFPEVTERPSHSAPTWFVRGKSTFATLWEHGHHQDDFPHLVALHPRPRRLLVPGRERRSRLRQRQPV